MILQTPFAGQVFLTLAREGRLVLPPAEADEVVASLERTLAIVLLRLRLLRALRRGQFVSGPHDRMGQEMADAAFSELLCPGRLEVASVELPKYIEAVRRAAGQIGGNDGAAGPR
ncbi:hypothetical protein [Micromonospora sp. HUAS LYJ1]|uniref:hypothetical protein n=1 Tax=Micromonospora sp. HUAS LYJ1 TaxID=3061626 RepID=UPI0026735C18|nr:hypothetical protein [Micromonospora sp. HUAS LYJ1]WKU05352.1 hypothetical protein Q2K16_32225 [Micromonospora sp. HUAS LYJ1]